MLMEARLLDERREGIAEGEANANIATAKRLFSMGLSVQDIAKATSLPIEQVKALQAEQQPYLSRTPLLFLPLNDSPFQRKPPQHPTANNLQSFCL